MHAIGASFSNIQEVGSLTRVVVYGQCVASAGCRMEIVVSSLHCIGQFQLFSSTVCTGLQSM